MGDIDDKLKPFLDVLAEMVAVKVLKELEPKLTRPEPEPKHDPLSNATVRYLRLPDVIARTGIARSTIYLMIQQGEFPKQTRIGGRAIAWLESEIIEWINTR